MLLFRLGAVPFACSPAVCFPNSIHRPPIQRPIAALALAQAQDEPRVRTKLRSFPPPAPVAMTQPAPANWRGVVASADPRPGSVGKARPVAGRSKSQPRAAPRGKSKPVKPPTAVVTPYEARVEAARQGAAGQSPEQLEARLQTLLRGAHFADAAYLIAASAHLSAQFQPADVVRLMLEAQPRAAEQAAQLVRDLHLQSNEPLVTLLVNALVRGGQFHAAVRVAQEMVPGFSGPAEASERPSWTPQALIQAMIRAGRFRAALKFSKQFNCLDAFRAPQLVAGMLETRSWEEAVSSVMEFQLFTEFPLEALAVRMLQQRQWALAVKCINKLPDKEQARPKFREALVREAAHVGDFVTAVHYLREFKLDRSGNQQTTTNLLHFLVDAMLAHGEFYKAIKYAMKFGLAKNPLDDAIAAAEAAIAVANGEQPAAPLVGVDPTEYLPQYSVETLIRKAMEGGQLHVATTYIKKLRLRERFAQELVQMDMAQQSRLLEFQRYAEVRLAQFQDPAFQQTLQTLLGSPAEDEMVELEPIVVEIVLSEHEEIIPRKAKKVQQAAREKEDEGNASAPQTNSSVEQQQSGPSVPPDNSGQSRFGFARPSPPLPPPPPGMAVTQTPPSTDDETRSKSVPPGRSAPPPGLFHSAENGQQENGQQDAASSVGGFNFAAFANSVQISGPPMNGSNARGPPPPPGPPPGHQQQQPMFLNQQQQQQQTQAIFSRSMPPMPNDQFNGFPSGYPAPPPMPQQNAMYFPRGNMPPGAMPPNQQLSYLQPPPPRPSSNGGGGFDVAALAMQFHNSGGGNGAPGFGGFGAPRPPMGYPGGSSAVPGPQQLFLGMPPPPPPLPSSSFKPSMSYTSVTTTRQKK
ncbi:hypothetical protein BBJ28_00014754 [Nothophytophthora sp. Chile5]|nr:hypothetical protein BBJ28_00014754 [Nothophytophthora sp. Chile5]